MPKIDVSDEILSDLGELAVPFVDKEPADVIKRLIREAKAKSGAAQDETPVHSTIAPPDLSHTKVVVGTINGAVMAKPNWNRLMDYAIDLAADKLKDSDAVSKIVLAKHVKGQKTDQGFAYFPKAKISVQGQDSNNAWKTTAYILKELGYKAEITFAWYDNPKAANPGKVGKFVVA
ncbi:MAG TPA: hypothetical protein VH206_01335 [Xanthobacteraceae bacterium]|jgi:hypothetical protein|nr:hypothetical protein [Xanthobacteraceae bacterium]